MRPLHREYKPVFQGALQRPTQSSHKSKLPNTKKRNDPESSVSFKQLRVEHSTVKDFQIRLEFEIEARRNMQMTYGIKEEGIG
jgi:hypothetical protein